MSSRSLPLALVAGLLVAGLAPAALASEPLVVYEETFSWFGTLSEEAQFEVPEPTQEHQFACYVRGLDRDTKGSWKATIYDHDGDLVLADVFVWAADHPAGGAGAPLVLQATGTAGTWTIDVDAAGSSPSTSVTVTMVSSPSACPP